eukprot:Protomagalhaensia_sp_Gyna_25__5519@NODE_742_length_2716_cov_19_772133_g581_i0_p1_GENE_NODE_742_length_2716_cov_19_772133_g581_i0NODE_742_length_2716_cov_19_772133_g581_i0_p1_ORF_typecomplete_len508_score76_46Big_2/PF02368_18/28Big_2/PF02368_18/44_NODE_742_length_2716_cov_19_772133_g581_i08522375
MPSGPTADFQSDSYGCRFTWTSDNPSVLSFLQDETPQSQQQQDSLNNDRGEEGQEQVPPLSAFKMGLFPKTAARVAGYGRIAATLFPLSPGSARVSLNVECLNKQHWNVLSRWSDTTHMSVFVSAPEDGLSDDHKDPLYARIPVLEYQEKKFFSVLPSLYSGTEKPSALTVYGSDASGGSVPGDVIRVLPGSQYQLKPQWSDSWEADFYCDTENGHLEHVTAATAAMCQQPASFRMEKSEEGVLVDVPNTEGTTSMIVFSSPNRRKMLYVPLLAVRPDELLLIPVTSLRDSRVPLPTTRSISTPLQMTLGERRQLKVLLKHQQKPILPDSALGLSVIVSHRSVLEVQRDLSTSSSLHITAVTPGCASITVSLEAYPLVVDAVLVCVAPPVTDRTIPLSQPSDAPGSTAGEQASMMWMWFKYAIEPWLVVRHMRSLLVVLLTIAAATGVIMFFAHGNGNFRVPNAPIEQVKPAYVPNWAASVTPSRGPGSRVRTFPANTASGHTKIRD